MSPSSIISRKVKNNCLQESRYIWGQASGWYNVCYPGHSSGRLFDSGSISRGTQLPRDYTVLIVWDVAIAGRACAGTGFTLFRCVGAGYYKLCGTRSWEHGISHLSRERGIIPDPAQNHGISRWLRVLCGASDTFTYLVRNLTQCRLLGFFVGSCSCLLGKCKRSVGVCRWSLFVRDVFVWELGILRYYSLCGTHSCGNGFTLFCGAGAGY